MQAPKCPSCGKSEWNHTCAGRVDRSSRQTRPAKPKGARPSAARPKAAPKGRIAAKKKVVAGLKDAIALARGDPTKARVTLISLAPEGDCDYCDYRRAAAAESMRKARAKQKKTEA